MDCAKCGKRIGFLYSQRKLRNKDVYPEFFDKALCPSCFIELTRVNKACPKCGKPFGFVPKAKLWESTEICPEWKGQYLHQECWIKEKQKEINCINCGFCEETMHNDSGVDSLGNYFDEAYSTYKCRKFNLDLKVPDDVRAKECSSYDSKNEYRNACISREMEKTDINLQIIFDFTSLKDIMAKSGLVITTFKCPNCSCRVSIPETGKVLECQNCQTPIKPMDIFAKIKTLIQ